MPPGTRTTPRRTSAAPRAVWLVVTRGPDRGTYLELRAERPVVVGTSSRAGVRLTDDSVSGRHARVSLADDGVHVTDLGSKNGSWYFGSRFDVVVLPLGSTIELGETSIDFLPTLPGSESAHLPGLVGESLAMRAVRAQVLRIGPSDLSTIVLGETGTGKEAVARAIHQASTRASAPFVTVDLAAVTESLIESELFGHRRGAFTSAIEDRRGAFDQADKGTVFLDEIGELPAAAQSRLLRVLATGEIKPVGAARHREVDVRVVAATNRDLEAETHQKRFRDDLYHRLAGVTITIPPLRERPEDIPALVAHFVQALVDRGRLARVLPAPPTLLARLAEEHWPGNIRQLRNVVERIAMLSRGDQLDERIAGDRGDAAASPTEPFHQAKDRLIAAWEREYVARALQAAGGNVSIASRRTGIARGHLHRLIKKHRLTEAAT